jgi:peptidyl-tRNA hydrolase
MRSIVDHLNQSRDFARLRIGIGTTIIYLFLIQVSNINNAPPPPPPHTNCFVGIGRPPEELGAINFVLRSFTKQEKEEVCTIVLDCTKPFGCMQICLITIPMMFYLSRPWYQYHKILT